MRTYRVSDMVAAWSDEQRSILSQVADAQFERAADYWAAMVLEDQDYEAYQAARGGHCGE